MFITFNWRMASLFVFQIKHPWACFIDTRARLNTNKLVYGLMTRIVPSLHRGCGTAFFAVAQYPHALLWVMNAFLFVFRWRVIFIEKNINWWQWSRPWNWNSMGLWFVLLLQWLYVTLATTRVHSNCCLYGRSKNGTRGEQVPPPTLTDTLATPRVNVVEELWPSGAVDPIAVLVQVERLNRAN